MAPDFAPTYEKATNMVFEEELYVPDNKAGKVDETGIVGATERLKTLDEGGDFITRSALSNRMKERTDNADPIDLYLDAIKATPYSKYLHVGGDEVHLVERDGKSQLELNLILQKKPIFIFRLHLIIQRIGTRIYLCLS